MEVGGRRNFSRKIHLQKSVQNFGQKVNSLGGVQPEMLERYKNVRRTVLGKELQKINQKLKKFDNVNKKALDQFVTFTEENERLVDRLK
jgi:structural maintenance of chromosome 3 (chondroitin sulfate proteoglycan 6)